MSVAWKWDVTAEASGTELVLTADPYTLTAQAAPMPDLDTQFGSSVDSPADRLTSLRYKNRRISLTVQIAAASAAALETAVADLTMKAGKTNRDAIVGGTGVGATLQYTSPTGDSVVFDVVSASVVADMGWTYAEVNYTSVVCEFECLPGWRGAETSPSDHTETTLPVLTFTESAVTGDLPGLGRLVVDEDGSKDQLSVIYGVRSKNYSSDATAALFWQAEALTPLAAGAATAAGPTGASGSGSNTVLADDLITSYQDILKSTVSTTYWTHVGSYRVIVRAYAAAANTGTVTLRAKWAQADVTQFTTGADVSTGAAGSWIMCDLGVVTVPRVLTGTQRWELMVQGKASVNLEDVYLDWVWLVPVDECSGVAEVSSAGAPLTQTISDEFTRASGNLDGDTPAPQTDGTGWVESTAGSFVMAATVATRTGVSDSGTYPSGLSANAKFACVGGDMTGSYIMADVFCTAGVGAKQGVMLRYADVSNWLAAFVDGAALQIVKCVAGTETILASDGCSVPLPVTYGGAQVFLYAPSNGGVYASVYGVSSAGVLGGFAASLSASDSALATGGALATGKAGLIDWQSSGTANTRSYDNLKAGTVLSDAACFAGQSIQVRHDGVVRSSASGIWTRPARFDGDYLLVPASGKESRPVEVTVRMSRAKLGTNGDEGVDDLSAKLHVRPRGLQLPS